MGGVPSESVHPIERLRWVARADGVGTSLLVREAAGALSGFADDPAALVTACRSLVDRHPTVGPIWWLAARCLTAADPEEEAWQVADAVRRDVTGAVLARELPGEATVAVLGWPEVTTDGLLQRPDLTLLVVDTGDAWSDRPRRLGDAGLDVVDVPATGLAAAAANADVVVIEADAVGPGRVLAAAGSRALAVVARDAAVPVWVTAGAGRVLPAPLFDALCRRLECAEEPWLEPVEVFGIGAPDRLVRLSGLLDVEAGSKTPDCPAAPELLRPLDAPGSYR